MLLRSRREEHACFLISHIKLHGNYTENYTETTQELKPAETILHYTAERWCEEGEEIGEGCCCCCSGGGEEHACLLKFSLKINYMENYTDIYTEIKSPADCTLHYTEWSKTTRTLVRRK